MHSIACSLADGGGKAIFKKTHLKVGFWWCLQESNQGHMDFQSIALPTELRHRLLRQIINLAAANIMVF